MRRRVLITGIGGQDGSLLAELLLEEGYTSPGSFASRSHMRTSTEFGNGSTCTPVDLLDEDAVLRALERLRPHEVYNLASVSFAPASWDDPVLTAQVGTVGTTILLEAIRRVDSAIRYCQASSSEIFGRPDEVPQTERTRLSPRNPYGAAKAYAFVLSQSYRTRHAVRVLGHPLQPRVRAATSPGPAQEGRTRWSRDRTRARTRVAARRSSSRRDWGYARDYVRAMWRMLQHPEPEDFFIATGLAHSVEELVACAFERVGLDWRGFVRLDPSLQRGEPALSDLVGDSSKARELLGWSQSVTFQELIHLLVDAELERLREATRSAEPSS